MYENNVPGFKSDNSDNLICDSNLRLVPGLLLSAQVPMTSDWHVVSCRHNTISGLGPEYNIEAYLSLHSVNGVHHFSVRHEVTTSLGTQSSDLWVIWRITFLSSDRGDSGDVTILVNSVTWDTSSKYMSKPRVLCIIIPTPLQDPPDWPICLLLGSVAAEPLSLRRDKNILQTCHIFSSILLWVTGGWMITMSQGKRRYSPFSSLCFYF